MGALKAMTMGFCLAFITCIIPVLFQGFFDYRPPFGEIGYVILGVIAGVGTVFAITLWQAG